MSRTIDDVAHQLLDNKKGGQSCVLLIGAGCSIEAGIPHAGKFVDEIRRRHQRKWESAKEKTYPACMAQLTSNERHTLITEFIDSARINWAHIAIAQLMAGGFVDRVLTTNFDPLVMRACALFNIWPAVYDMVSLGEDYRASWVRDKAVFHLHGQRDGFFQAHTQDHVNALESRLGGLFRDCAARRTWIVVGYSGENDPVFRQLEKMPEFDNDLYWVSYKAKSMPAHLSPLMEGGKGAHWINDTLGADNFLYQLADKVGCPVPPFFDKPFSHLRETVKTIAGFKLPGAEAEIPVTQDAMAKIDKAIRCVEPTLTCAADGLPSKPARKKAAKPDIVKKADRLLMAGKYDEVIALEHELMGIGTDAAHEVLAWAFTEKGGVLRRRAEAAARGGKDGLLREACLHHQRATEFRGDLSEVWSNWGNALSDCAEAKGGDEALFREAEEKYIEALRLNPDMHAAWYNWGTAALGLARARGCEESLLREAGEKFAQAVSIKPDRDDAWNNWGNALSDWAKVKGGDEGLWREAGEKYAEALRISLGMYEAWDNWGSTLVDWAKAKGGDDDLLQEAEAKCRQANSLKPGYGSYNLACISALRGQPGECRKWLEESFAHGDLPDRKHLTSDSDLDSVRNEPWFAEILAKAKE